MTGVATDGCVRPLPYLPVPSDMASTPPEGNVTSRTTTTVVPADGKDIATDFSSTRSSAAAVGL